jgi:hypothetical protein
MRFHFVSPLAFYCMFMWANPLPHLAPLLLQNLFEMQFGVNGCSITNLIIRRFYKIAKSTISVLMSVRPSVCPHEKNSAPTGRIFMKFGIYFFF